MSTSPTRATLLVGGLFLAGLFAGALTGTAAADRATDPYAGLDLFARVLTLAEDKFVDEIEHEVLVEAAVRGIMEELDDHSRYLDADEYAAFKDDTNGNYEGIGVEVRRIPEGVLVSRVLPGGPAERDGLLAQDRIIAVDGHDLAGATLDEVASKLKGPRGDAVTVTVVREGWDDPRDIDTVRDRIHTPAVSGEKLGNISYIRLISFQDDSAKAVEKEYRAHAKEGDIKGLVLDLRDNPGGLLDQAVAVTDLFIDTGRIVSTRSRVEGEQTFDATVGGISTELPLVVLINGMSASASEIVAGAIQDRDRGALVGTHSYGKGSVQTLFENRDSTAVKLTVGRYYTPSGEAVTTKEGRKPDHEVPYPTEPTKLDLLNTAIAELQVPQEQRDELLALTDSFKERGERDVLIEWDKSAAERLLDDPQLRLAFELVGGDVPQLADDVSDEVVVPSPSDE